MLHASAFLKWDPKRHLCQLKAGFSVLSDSKLYNKCPKTVFVYFLLYIDYQMIAYNQKRRQKRIIFDSELWKGQIQMSSLIWAYSKAHHWIIFDLMFMTWRWCPPTIFRQSSDSSLRWFDELRNSLAIMSYHNIIKIYCDNTWRISYS